MAERIDDEPADVTLVSAAVLPPPAPLAEPPAEVVHPEPPNGGYEVLIEGKPQGLIRRAIVTYGEGAGLILGGLVAYVKEQRRLGLDDRFAVVLMRILLLLAWPFLDRDLVRQPFPVQFRVRLERLGPTYIKLGQILSLREDLLPKAITDELKNLLDRLPALPFDRYVELLELTLGRPVNSFLSELDAVPLGSASLAQTHRGRLLSGEEIVTKMLKPNVRQMIITDTRLMRVAGSFAEIFLSRYQPKRLINEFCRYTVLEVDLRNEADNAEIFAANFRDEPDVHFPAIYRAFSNRDVLCMTFFRGSKPDARITEKFTSAELDKVISLGVGATVKMIFRDGFFHADLHPGNLIVFDDASVGFIDLGMVGRLDNDLRKRMLYYLYALVSGDAGNAARYLTSMTVAGPKGDPTAFRNAVEDLNRRWLRSPNFDEFSLGQLIMQSITLAGEYYIQYPGEIILMVKSLVTLEGVGNVLAPGINVAEAAQGHVQKIVYGQFNLRQVLQDGVLLLPELVDLLYRSPLVLNEGLRFVESELKRSRDNPLGELRGTLFGGFTMIAGAIVVAADGPTWLWAGLLLAGFMIAGVGIFSRR